MILVSGSTSAKSIGGCGAIYKIENDTVVPLFLTPSNDVYGITQYADFWLAGIRGSTPNIRIMDSNFRRMKNIILPPSADVHSIFTHDGKIKVVSSAEDKLYIINPTIMKLIGTEQYGLGYDNRYHVNDITPSPDGLLTTMFRNKIQENISWRDNIPQGVMQVADNSPVVGKLIKEDMIKPHSPIIFKDKMYVCDSGRGRVLVDGRVIFEDSSMWTRGLAVTDQFVYVGCGKNYKLGSVGVQKAIIIKLSHTGDMIERIETPLLSIYTLINID